MSKQFGVKLHVPGGWSTAAREHLIDLCTSDRFKDYVFIDRLGINDRTLNKANLNIIQFNPDRALPEKYIFFAHTQWPDLPHDTTICRGT